MPGDMWIVPFTLPSRSASCSPQAVLPLEWWRSRHRFRHQVLCLSRARANSKQLGFGLDDAWEPWLQVILLPDRQVEQFTRHRCRQTPNSAPVFAVPTSFSVGSAAQNRYRLRGYMLRW